MSVPQGEQPTSKVESLQESEASDGDHLNDEKRTVTDNNGAEYVNPINGGCRTLGLEMLEVLDELPDRSGSEVFGR